MGKLLEAYQSFLTGNEPFRGPSKLNMPPAIAKTLGARMTAVGQGTATVELTTRTDVHANPMGTVHGGVLADIADLAIGVAHSTMLEEGESFTSVDLQINFFRPVWNETIRAEAKPIHQGKTISRYVCDVLRADGKMVAQVTSTVMTLRGGAASGR